MVSSRTMENGGMAITARGRNLDRDPAHWKEKFGEDGTSEGKVQGSSRLV